MDYSMCKFSDLGNCGEYKRRKQDGIFNFVDLGASVLEYQKKLFRNIDEELFEYDLIQSRSGRTFQETEKICAFHWYNYGIDWRPLKQCLHFQHREKKCPGIKNAFC